MGRDFIDGVHSHVVNGMSSIAGAVVAGLFLAGAGVPRSTSRRYGPIRCVRIMVVMLMVRPQGLFGRLGYA